MSAPLRIAVAGLGTVGAGALKLLEDNAELLQSRCGRSIEVVAVSARDASKDRGVDLSGVRWEQDPLALLESDAEVIVELMGGSEGAARGLVEGALARGKHVVTANKALVAHHGIALAQLAEKHHAVLAFEAAVAGGIPIIQTLRDGLGANRFTCIAGILNGTCNYILTTMQKQGRDFDDVLQEAQALGYAEADPSFDVDGIDAAHKLSILTSLAYGVPVDIHAIHIEGIRSISAADIAHARELGYRIKLLGIAQMTAGGVLQRVHPCLVRESAPIAAIDGAFNAIHLEGNAVGRVLLEGAGAGAGPTASSVVADIVQIARGAHYYPFTVKSDALVQASPAAIADMTSRYYLRLSVKDEPGVLADITAIFGKAGISVQSLIQHDHTPDTPARIVITTHDTKESAMQQALQQIAALATVLESPQMIRMESL